MTAPTDGDPGAGGGGRSGPEAGRQRSRPAPTATGRSVLTAGVALVVLGWSLGYPVLAVIGLGGLLAVAAALAAVTRQPTPEVERRLEPLRVARGQAALGVVTVGAAGGRRSAACVAVEPVGNRQVRVRLPSLPPGRRTSVPYRLPTDRRGAVPVGPLTLLRQDPLGLCAGHQAVGGVATLWVRPHVVPIPARPGGRSRHLEGHRSDTSALGTSSFDALREYVVGDDLRMVHWRTSARTGTLMVRQHVDTSHPSTVVVLDTRADRYRAEDFEEAVDVVASVVTSSGERGFPVRLVLTSGETVLSRRGQSPGHLMDRLAEVETTAAGLDRGLAALGSGLLRSRDHDTLVVVGGTLDEADRVAVTTMSRPFSTVVVTTLGLPADRGPEALAAALHLHGATAAEVLEQWTGAGR